MKYRDPLLARHPFSDTKFNIFGKEDASNTFSSQLEAIQQGFKSQFLSNDIGSFQQNLAFAALATSFVPYLGAALGALSVLLGFIFTDGDWQNAIVDMIGDMDDFNNVKEGIRAINRDLKDINGDFEFLNVTKYQQYHIYDINKRLKSIIESFAEPDSIYKKYPLIAAPYLILVSLTWAAFEPIVSRQMPEETKKAALSCQAYDLMIDYRTYTVDARIDQFGKIDPDKLAEEYTSLFELRDFIKKYPYDPKSFDSNDYASYIRCKNDPNSKNCIEDNFGTAYCNNDNTCQSTYGNYIRHHVEKMFPVDQLKKMCEKDWPNRKESGKHSFKLRKTHSENSY